MVTTWSESTATARDFRDFLSLTLVTMARRKKSTATSTNFMDFLSFTLVVTVEGARELSERLHETQKCVRNTTILFDEKTQRKDNEDENTSDSSDKISSESILTDQHKISRTIRRTNPNIDTLDKVLLDAIRNTIPKDSKNMY